MVLFDDEDDGRSVEDSVTDLGDRIFDAETVLDQLKAKLDDLQGKYEDGELESVCPYCFNYIPSTDGKFLNYCVTCSSNIGFVYLISLDDSIVVRIEETI